MGIINPSHRKSFRPKILLDSADYIILKKINDYEQSQRLINKKSIIHETGISRKNLQTHMKRLEPYLNQRIAPTKDTKRNVFLSLNAKGISLYLLLKETLE